MSGRKSYLALLSLSVIVLCATEAWASGLTDMVFGPGAGELGSGQIHAAPGTGIRDTAHDFTGNSIVKVGLCTYCHTPHKAASTVLLWNHTLSANNFSWDAPATSAGTVYPTFSGRKYQGPSAQCLSCHDGTLAVGDLAWFNGSSSPSPLNETKLTGASQIASTTGSLLGAHPVAMPYPYDRVQSTYNGIRTGGGFISSQWQPTPIEPVRLYSDDGTGKISAAAIQGKSGVECSSCHDPHNKRAVDDMFLLGTFTGNDTNYICLKCHIK